jgi:hypothetical protein
MLNDLNVRMAINISSITVFGDILLEQPLPVSNNSQNRLHVDFNPCLRCLSQLARLEAGTNEILSHPKYSSRIVALVEKWKPQEGQIFATKIVRSLT